MLLPLVSHAGCSSDVVCWGAVWLSTSGPASCCLCDCVCVPDLTCKGQQRHLEAQPGGQHSTPQQHSEPQHSELKAMSFQVMASSPGYRMSSADCPADKNTIDRQNSKTRSNSRCVTRVYSHRDGQSHILHAICRPLDNARPTTRSGDSQITKKSLASSPSSSSSEI